MKKKILKRNIYLISFVIYFILYFYFVWYCGTKFYNKNIKVNLNAVSNVSTIDNLNINCSLKINSIDTEEKNFYPLTDSERELIANLICGEAGSGSYLGKVCIANCILNACLKDELRPEEVALKYGYKEWKLIENFKMECEIAYGNTILVDEIYEAIEQVFVEGELYNSEMIWFYNPDYGYSAFHESMKYIETVENHKFFGEW